MNECLLGIHHCDQSGICTDIDFSFDCSCPDGWDGDGGAIEFGGTGCIEPNCENGGVICPAHSECISTIDGYICTCDQGYETPDNGDNVCEDIDECLTGTDTCTPEQFCDNTVGSFSCVCNGWYDDINGDGSVCQQIDQCDIGNPPDIGIPPCDPNAECIEHDVICSKDGCFSDLGEGRPIGDAGAGFRCECKAGYMGDGRNTELTFADMLEYTGCTDADECELGTAECPDHSSCVNTEGSYECICDDGYKKPKNGNNICKDIDECDDGSHNCPTDNGSCSNTDGAFECICDLGYAFNKAKTKCKDKDECDTPLVCGDENAKCINTEGSFNCKCKNGFGKRISCPDTDECTTGIHNCHKDLAICKNTFGSFECECPDGYETNNDGVTCEEKDECSNGEADCPAHSTCENTIGSYQCNCDDGWKKPANGNNICKDIDECKSDDTYSCPTEAECVNNDGSYDCICRPEDVYQTMIYDTITVCEFRNECYEGTDNCDDLATCIHVDSVDPRYICECPSGYDGDGIAITSGGTGCQKRNPCEDGTAQCPENSVCGSTDDGYECLCFEGYMKPANGNNICKDVDECSYGHTCHEWADCINTDGSFECICKEGTFSFGDKCMQENECEADVCSENSMCTDINFGYMCDCIEGYEADGSASDQLMCIDVDECTKGTANCPDHSNCVNNDGGYACECHDGYKKPANGNNICKEINECKDEIHNCHEWAECTNTAGSFECACGVGTIGNGVQCTQVDECETGWNECDLTTTTCQDQDFGYICSCKDGWVKGVTEYLCDDQDECNDGTAECPDHSTCVNNPGSYDCECNNGYKKPANGKNICKDINECDLGSIEDVCGDTNAICTNTDGSYSCVCMSGFGRSTRRLISCPDIDECALGTHNCSDNAECTNTEGSFECSCNDGFVENGDNVCEDIDECLTGTDTCTPEQFCDNTIGSFSCVCNGWYNDINGDGSVCEQIDQCDIGNPPDIGTPPCDPNAECIEHDVICSKDGCFSDLGEGRPIGDAGAGWRCECKAGYMGDGRNTELTFADMLEYTGCTDANECELGTAQCPHHSSCKNTDGSYECICDDGWKKPANGNNICKDINECASDDTNNCPENSTCNNTEGSFECSCNDGFDLNKENVCEDIDECLLGTDTCTPEQFCDNTEGSFSCVCHGWFNDINGDGSVCEQIDQCDIGSPCDPNADCIEHDIMCSEDGCFSDYGQERPIGDPSDGSRCLCKLGYMGDGKNKNSTFAETLGYTGCTDVNECEIGTAQCPDHSTCVNIEGSYECNCNDGWKKPANGKNICKDIDECASDDANKCPDDATCNNTEGSYECVCNDPLEEILTNPGPDSWFFCHDINECFNDVDNCVDVAMCTDTLGSFFCTCPEGYTGDGVDTSSGGTGCTEVAPECQCDFKTQVCDETSGTCKCKPGYLETDAGCVFDFSVCPDNVKDTPVKWSGNTMKTHFESANGQDVIGKIKIKKRSQKQAYTGFLVFPKIYCGGAFVDAIADGTLYVEFFDKQQQYQMTDFNYYRNANTGYFVTATKQFQ